MTDYYNENNPFSAEWLRELIRCGVIEDGEVDERSITEVKAADLRGFHNCHFFAGIGVWAYALAKAEWPKTERCWTGSCPCQPFSVSGKRGLASDERHLWPTWFNLIRESRPERIFGEQVASDDGLAWLDLVSTDLENEDYTIGALDTCAASVGAPHIRQRLYFVAYARHGSKSNGLQLGAAETGVRGASREQRIRNDGSAGGAAGQLADAHGPRQQTECDSRRMGETQREESDDEPKFRRETKTHFHGGATDRLADTECDGRRTDESGRGPQEREAHGRDGEAGDVADTERRRREQCDTSERGIQQLDADSNVGVTISAGLEGHAGNGNGSNESGWQRENENGPTAPAGPLNGFWADAEWLYCRDGKYRPTKPGLRVLANGTSGRVGKLRGYGNALVATQAIAFIKAYLEEIK